MNAVEQGMQLARGVEDMRKAQLPAVVDADGDTQRVEPVELIAGLLQMVGEDPQREGLADTPKRVVKAWRHWCSGYAMDPSEILRVSFSAENYDEMVLVRDIPLYSKCEHHLADIFGTACVAYIPADGKVVGLSKLSRIVDCFARRLQMQERITAQIADAIQEHLQPKGVGVLIRARHMCMESRGICQQGHHTVTTALRGAMREDARTRAEFLSAAA